MGPAAGGRGGCADLWPGAGRGGGRGRGRAGQAGAAPPAQTGQRARGRRARAGHSGRAAERERAAKRPAHQGCGSHAAGEERRGGQATRAEAVRGLQGPRGRRLGPRRRPRTEARGPGRGREPGGGEAAVGQAAAAIVASGAGGGRRRAAAGAAAAPACARGALGVRAGPGRAAGALGDVPEAAEAQLRGRRQAAAGHLVSAARPGRRLLTSPRRPSRAPAGQRPPRSASAARQGGGLPAKRVGPALRSPSCFCVCARVFGERLWGAGPG